MSFLKLNSISGLPESLISGKNAALEDCLSENEVKWNSKNYQNVVALWENKVDEIDEEPDLGEIV